MRRGRSDYWDMALRHLHGVFGNLDWRVGIIWLGCFGRLGQTGGVYNCVGCGGVYDREMLVLPRQR